jgi:hypothetical protein
MQVDPLHIHNTKRDVPPDLYKQCVTPPTRRYQVSGATPWQEIYLAHIFLKRKQLVTTFTKMYVLLGRK